ncbi:MAG: beta-3-deoxy-D-manno-oct-2-ulosonic acid transferase [Rhodoferax sp.]|nr:beta-3-deoxy-D-manno-oct-2-ulosonic acid transferase [Rhodoferax sp.]
MTASAFAWRPRLVACGFSLRKRALVRDFTGRPDVQFAAAPPADAGAETDLLLWGAKPPPPTLPADVRVVRVEDGFLRSVGLGADLTRPLSWVLDTRGIYFDPRTPSDLEVLLQEGEFPEVLLQRAAALRQQLVQAGLSKYNLAGIPWQRPATQRPVVLVVGQVETDASIATGTLDIRTNIGLLRAVREQRPDAWLVYKPHPDVEAGLRRRGAHEEQARHGADEVLQHGAMAQILPLVDEVHVMTSLAGFEALLRERPVVCHGQPFYAGWGLTTDRHPHPRRTRRLALDALVAAALLLYPVYVAPRSRQRCTPEEALQALVAQRDAAAARGPDTPAWRRLVRPLLARP